MLNKTKIRSVEFGGKFTLHPQSDKFYFKSQENQKPDGTVISVKCTRVSVEGGVCYFDPDHIVYKEEV
jgi:hypothetical protein